MFKINYRLVPLHLRCGPINLSETSVHTSTYVRISGTILNWKQTSGV
jgi:hypothetical protein